MQCFRKIIIFENRVFKTFPLTHSQHHKNNLKTKTKLMLIEYFIPALNKTTNLTMEEVVMYLNKGPKLLASVINSIRRIQL